MDECRHAELMRAFATILDPKNATALRTHYGDLLQRACKCAGIQVLVMTSAAPANAQPEPDLRFSHDCTDFAHRLLSSIPRVEFFFQPNSKLSLTGVIVPRRDLRISVYRQLDGSRAVTPNQFLARICIDRSFAMQFKAWVATRRPKGGQNEFARHWDPADEAMVRHAVGNGLRILSFEKKFKTEGAAGLFIFVYTRLIKLRNNVCDEVMAYLERQPNVLEKAKQFEGAVDECQKSVHKSLNVDISNLPNGREQPRQVQRRGRPAKVREKESRHESRMSTRSPSMDVSHGQSNASTVAQNPNLAQIQPSSTTISTDGGPNIQFGMTMSNEQHVNSTMGLFGGGNALLPDFNTPDPNALSNFDYPMWDEPPFT